MDGGWLPLLKVGGLIAHIGMAGRVGETWEWGQGNRRGEMWRLVRMGRTAGVRRMLGWLVRWLACSLNKGETGEWGQGNWRKGWEERGHEANVGMVGGVVGVEFE